jgi:hypothetical protein
MRTNRTPVTGHRSETGYPPQASSSEFSLSGVGYAIDRIDARLAALGRHLRLVERPLEAAGVDNIRRALFDAQIVLAIVEVQAES